MKRKDKAVISDRCMLREESELHSAAFDPYNECLNTKDSYSSGSFVAKFIEFIWFCPGRSGLLFGTQALPLQE
jgi:hypothetical protein